MAEDTAANCAIVFGASGAIGGALAAKLAATGRFAAVYGTARSLEERPQRAFHWLSCDVTDERSVKACAERIAEPPALVIAATGLLHDGARGIAPEKSLRSIDPEAMAAVYAHNAIAPALIAKHVLPRLPRDSRAVFAVLSARVGSIGDNRLGGWHSYRASKAALNMLVRNFAIELARSHPRAVVAALHPGTVDSALSAPFQRGVAPDKLFTPGRAAGHLLEVIDRLTPADSGGLFAWNGERLPY